MPTRPSHMIEKYKPVVPLVEPGSDKDIMAYAPGDRVLIQAGTAHVTPAVVRTVDVNGLHLDSINEGITYNVSPRAVAVGKLIHSPKNLSYANLFDVIEAHRPTADRPKHKLVPLD